MDAYDIIKMIKESKKTTPVKAYIKAHEEINFTINCF